MFFLTYDGRVRSAEEKAIDDELLNLRAKLRKQNDDVKNAEYTEAFQGRLFAIDSSPSVTNAKIIVSQIESEIGRLKIRKAQLKEKDSELKRQQGERIIKSTGTAPMEFSNEPNSIGALPKGVSISKKEEKVIGEKPIDEIKQKKEDPLQILKIRFAKGEINRQEFEEMKSTLLTDSKPIQEKPPKQNDSEKVTTFSRSTTTVPEKKISSTPDGLFCTNCGQTLKSNMKFCGKCGTSVQT